jgi:hypothetical protein
MKGLVYPYNWRHGKIVPGTSMEHKGYLRLCLHDADKANEPSDSNVNASHKNHVRHFPPPKG